MRFLSEKYRLLWLLIIILVIGFLATSLLSYFVSRSAVHNSIIQQQLPLSSDNIYSEIQQDLLRPINVSAQMSQDTFLKDWIKNGEQDKQQVVRYLAAIKKQFGTNTAFFISETTHRYYHAEGLFGTIQEGDPAQQWYFDLKRSPVTHQVEIDADKVHGGVMTAFIDFKMFDEQKRFLGITGVGISLNTHSNLTDRYQQKYNRRVYFVDAQGNVLIAKNSHAANIHQSPGIAKIAAQILNADKAPMRLEYRSLDGTTVQVNSRYVPALGWFLLVEENESETIKPLRFILMSNLAIGLLALCLVGTIMLLTINKYQAHLEHMATQDGLSGLANRAMGEMLLDQSMVNCSRYQQPLSVILLDIDYFKKINDTYGHHVGDNVIAAIGKLLKTTCRQSDVVARWGGEEFLVVMHDCDLAQAKAMCEKIATKFAQYAFSGVANTHKVTASFGVAGMQPGELRHDLLIRADNALYTAKAEGRNHIVVSSRA